MCLCVRRGRERLFCGRGFWCQCGRPARPSCAIERWLLIPAETATLAACPPNRTQTLTRRSPITPAVNHLREASLSVPSTTTLLVLMPPPGNQPSPHRLRETSPMEKTTTRPWSLLLSLLLTPGSRAPPRRRQSRRSRGPAGGTASGS